MKQHPVDCEIDPDLPRRCNLCDYLASNALNFDQHRMVFHDKRSTSAKNFNPKVTYSCFYCSKRYCTSAALLLHMRAAHHHRAQDKRVRTVAQTRQGAVGQQLALPPLPPLRRIPNKKGPPALFSAARLLPFKRRGGARVTLQGHKKRVYPLRSRISANFVKQQTVIPVLREHLISHALQGADSLVVALHDLPPSPVKQEEEEEEEEAVIVPQFPPKQGKGSSHKASTIRRQVPQRDLRALPLRTQPTRAMSAAPPVFVPSSPEPDPDPPVPAPDPLPPPPAPEPEPEPEPASHPNISATAVPASAHMAQPVGPTLTNVNAAQQLPSDSRPVIVSVAAPVPPSLPTLFVPSASTVVSTQLPNAQNSSVVPVCYPDSLLPVPIEDKFLTFKCPDCHAHFHSGAWFENHLRKHHFQSGPREFTSITTMSWNFPSPTPSLDSGSSFPPPPPVLPSVPAQPILPSVPAQPIVMASPHPRAIVISPVPTVDRFASPQARLHAGSVLRPRLQPPRAPLQQQLRPHHQPNILKRQRQQETFVPAPPVFTVAVPAQFTPTSGWKNT